MNSRICLIRASVLLGLFFSLANAGGQVFTFVPLHSFTSDPDGSDPLAVRLIQGSDGNFYGTTLQGGTNGLGTVYSISPSGLFSPLYSFTGGPDGEYPEGGLVQGNDGNVYGIAEYGGIHTVGGPSFGNGSIFKMSYSGAITVLYDFTNGVDGSAPGPSLVQGSDGDFYGTSYSGGTNGKGTVFRTTSAGVLTPLYAFQGGTDGYHPSAPLIQGRDGSYYGTAEYGGTNGYGTVFKISASGSFTSLYSFTNGVDGGYPWRAALVQGNDGAFYGMTPIGGAYEGGSIFKITPQGVLTPVYSFSDNGEEGAEPFGGLALGNDGNFYGTASEGSGGTGFAFNVTTNGSLTVLYTFTNGIDGGVPYGGLTQGSDSNWYGTASQGGASGNGTIFKLDDVPPPPNDDWANAYVVEGTSYLMTNASNIGATLQPGENPYDEDFGASVWWTWTPDLNGNLYVTLNSNSLYIQIYTSSELLSSFEAFADGYGYAIAPVTAGTQYYISVSGADGAEGNFPFQLTENDLCYPPTPNPPIFSTSETNESDGIHVTFCTDVTGTGLGANFWTVVSPENYISTIDDGDCFTVVVAATNEQPVEVNMTVTGQCGTSGGSSQPVTSCGFCLSRGEPGLLTGMTGGGAGPSRLVVGCGQLSSSALWYVMVPSQTGLVTVSTEGSGIDTLLAVFSGPINALTNVACTNGIIWATQQSRLTFNAVSGREYWFAVDPVNSSTANLHVASGFVPRIESFGMRTNGTFSLKSTIAPAIPYTVLASTNLSMNTNTWTVVLTTNLSASSPYINYQDTNARSTGQRFYELGQ